MMRVFGAFCGALLCSSTVMAWQIEVADPVLQKQLQTTLDEKQLADAELKKPSSAAEIEQGVLADLKSRGYYQAYIRQQGESLVIELGEPVRISALHLSGLTSDQRLQLPSYPQRVGDVLDQQLYENFKTTVDSRFLERGYFSAHWQTAQIALDLYDSRAEITLQHHRGERSRFGAVSFVNDAGEPLTSLSPFWLYRLTPFEAGDYYSSKKLIELQNNLLDTRYFSDVQVNVVRAEHSDGSERVLPVRVQVRDDKPNKVSLGLGYATDVGPRVSVDWQRPRLNAQGHGISANAQVSEIRQETQWHYQVPYRHPTQDTLQFSVGALRDSINDIDTEKLVVGVQRVIAPKRGWQVSFGTRLTQERFSDPNAFARSERFLLPSLSLSHRQVRGGTDPYQGVSQRYVLEAASDALLSDASLLSMQGRWQWLNTFQQSHLLMLRAELAHVFTRDVAKLPPTMRFFAGGDNSVRGYDYREIAPRDANGETIGGQTMVVGSTEYQWHWQPRWRPAVFIDAGQAYTDNWVPLAIGAGVGMRWISPVGPIHFDLANAVSDDKQPWRVHITIGAPL